MLELMRQKKFHNLAPLESETGRVLVAILVFLDVLLGCVLLPVVAVVAAGLFRWWRTARLSHLF